MSLLIDVLFSNAKFVRLTNLESHLAHRLRDEKAVKVFEGGLTSIGGEQPTPLVPATALVTKK